MANTTWVLIANSSYAQIYEVKGHGKHVKKIHHMDNPDGRKKESEIVSDRAGRSYDSFGFGRHAVEPKVNFKERRIQPFAHQINEYLTKERSNESFHELVLMAPSHFIGELQTVFSEPMKKLVIKELSKDLPAYLSEQEIVDHLRKDLDLWNHD